MDSYLYSEDKVLAFLIHSQSDAKYSDEGDKDITLSNNSIALFCSPS